MNARTVCLPMQTVEKRALERAVEIVGSPESLARRLDVSSDRLDYWLSGLLPIPPEVFAAVADLLLEQDLAELKRDSSGQQERPKPIC